MGKRLSKIYTRTGDAGETGLGDGSRVLKTNPRIEAIGDVDELNSSVGLLIEELTILRLSAMSPAIDFLKYCQHRIFDLGGELSIPGYKIINGDHVTAIEHQLDEMNQSLPALENFILPGGSKAIAQCHMSRSICRRAERRLVALKEARHETESINLQALEYLNRLSDYLFVLARFCTLHSDVKEVLWSRD